MPKPKFTKGGAPGPGRPKGQVNKFWATLQYWAGRLENTLDDPELSIDKRAEVELEMFKILLERRKLPPEDPDESKQNAIELHERMKKLEEDARNGARSISS